MLELRTNGVLDVEKIKSWTEAQEQLECLSMRQLYGVLERMPGCKKVPQALSVLETLCGGSSRDQRTERKPGRRVT